MYQKIYKSGLFVYLALFILSLVFYKERIIILDDAYYLFNIVKDARFSIEHFRYIAVVTEIFPLLAVKLSLPLPVVAMAYSAGFIIYYSVCYLICGWLKEYKLALVLLLVNILFSTHTFYWMLSELTQGLAMMIVLLAVINSRDTIPRFMLVAALVLLIPTIAFAHPLLVFPFSFGLLFMAIDKESNIDKKWCAGVLIAYFAVLVCKSIFFKEAYEEQSMQGLNNFKTLFPNYFNLHSNRVFLKNCLLKYQWIPIVFIATTAVLYRSGKIIKLWLYLFYVIGFMALVNIAYHSSYTQEFYIENLYLPLGFLLGLPFVFEVLPAIAAIRLRQALITALFITCVIRISLGHRFYTERLNWQRHYLEEHGHEKLIVDIKYLPKDILLMPWGSPYEFWLLSTIEQKKTASILFTEHMGEVEWGKDKQGSMMTTWGAFAYEHLPAKYFVFTDTLTKYRIIK
jgi:hypothetical protein